MCVCVCIKPKINGGCLLTSLWLPFIFQFYEFKKGNTVSRRHLPLNTPI